VLEHIAQTAGQFAGRVLFSPGDKAVLTLKLRKGEDPLRAAAALVDAYAAARGNTDEN
jgi:transcription-repair coupling factor (superfamily II helicase)